MLRLRPFVPEDAEAVAAMHARVYPDSGWASQAACASYLCEMLFRNPWRDPQLPSWVAEDAGGMAGFLGVLPRRMLFGARPIRVAVGCQFMVAPEKRSSFAALELLRRLLSGPQELTVADGANDASRRLWEAAGGVASPLHALHWMKLLRPARGLLRYTSEHRWLAALNTLGAPLAALADACVAGLSPARRASVLRAEELTGAALAEALRQHRGSFALRPDCDAASLDWLIAQARSKRRHGELQGALLRDRAGRAVGWFLYYLNDGVSKVLTAGAGREHMPALLEEMFAHARERGALALEGRLEPHLAPALKGKHCLLQDRGIATLLHARDPALLVPFLRGDALFTRLDGEWWMRFAGEPAPAAPAAAIYDRLQLRWRPVARLIGL